MPASNALKPIAAQPGKPLYQTVRESIRQAIDEGIIRPDEQLPSTKELSDQLQVSLVTAHRALQELAWETAAHYPYSGVTPKART